MKIYIDEEKKNADAYQEEGIDDDGDDEKDRVWWKVIGDDYRLSLMIKIMILLMMMENYDCAGW